MNYFKQLLVRLLFIFKIAGRVAEIFLMKSYKADEIFRKDLTIYGINLK